MFWISFNRIFVQHIININGKPLIYYTIQAAKKSKFLKEVLGLELHRAFIAIKEMEYQKVASTVSELDIDLYLNAI